MANAGTLLLTLLNDRGDQISGKARIELRHERLNSERKVVKEVDASKTLRIAKLRAAPDGLYKLSVHIAGFVPARQFLNVRSDGPTEIQVSFRPKSKALMIDEALELAREGIETQRRVDDLLREQLAESVDVYRIVIAPWLSKARRITEASLKHLKAEARSGKDIAFDGILSNFERQTEAMGRLEEKLRDKPPATASSECTSEAGWAAASIAVAVGTCAVSLGFGCAAGAVFAVKALDDATEACQ